MENDYRIYATRNKAYWGPIFWDFLYLTVMGFPVSMTTEQSREFSNLIQNFHVFLPCADCRQHYKREVRNINCAQIKDKNTAMNVVLHLHNQVRARQGKRFFSHNDIINYHFVKSRGAVVPTWVIVAVGVLFLFKFYMIPATPG